MSLHEIQTKKPANGALSNWIRANAAHRGEDCLRWPFSFATVGYPGNTLWNGKQMFGHRAMCIAAHGEPPSNNLHAAHSCGNRWCINPNHIRWSTASDNQMDRVGHGTSNRGSAHGMSRLREADVLAISRSKLPAKTLASHYAVSSRAIRDIRNGSTWGWLTGVAK